MNMASHKNNIRDQKGFALVTVTVMSFLLFTFTLTYFDVAITMKRQVYGGEMQMISEAMAEAAIEDVMWEVNYGGNDYDTGSGWTTSGSNKVKTVASFTNSGGTSIGNYTITVSDWSTSYPKASIVATAVGSPISNTVNYKLGMKPRPAFDSSMRAGGQITMKGNFFTDSYDSASAYGGGNVKSNGNIITNGAAVDIIDFIGTPYVNGTANTAPGGTVSNEVYVSGNIYDTANFTLPAVTVPSGLTSLSSGGNLNATLSLGAGSYKFAKIDLAGSSTLAIAGNVTLYLTNTTGNGLQLQNSANIIMAPGATLTIYTNSDVDMAGNSLINYSTTSQNASNVRIYGTSTCDNIDIGGSAKFCGLIYAPSAAVDIQGSAKIYGSMVADEMMGQGNAEFHYDENAVNYNYTIGSQLNWIRKV